MMRAIPLRCWLTLLPVSAALLSGCVLGGPNSDDLHAWMTQERNNTRPRVPPLEPPKVFIPKDYAASSNIQPFDPLKLLQVLRSDETRQTDTRLIEGELTRRKEPLEAVPLDAMALVGFVGREGEANALIRVDGLLHQVQVGNYLGQHYGRITQITESSVQLREIVQDGAGDWVERISTLNLEEGR